MTAALSVQSVSREFPKRGSGEVVRVLDQVTFDVAPGEIVCIVGPSGCGKTTLLNILAGFDHPTGGRAFANGRRIVEPDPERAVVFQEAALFPWLNAKQNITFGLKEKRLKRAQRNAIGDEYLALVGLQQAESRLPSELSGGMRQRVALARALANGASVLLLDEPFAALDAQTRQQMHGELLRIWNRVHTTMVLITHAIDEAVTLADRVLVMLAEPGRIAETISISLARPRDDTSHEFNEIKRHIRTLLPQPRQEDVVA